MYAFPHYLIPLVQYVVLIQSQFTFSVVWGCFFLYIISYLIFVMMLSFWFYMYLIHPSINNMFYLLGKSLCMKLKTVIVIRLSMFITKPEVFKIKFLLTTRSWTNILVILTFTVCICKFSHISFNVI